MNNEAQASDPALVPVRQQIVDFYGDELAASQLADGTVLVPLRPICEALGLNWSGQVQRTRRHPVLGAALRFVYVTHTNPAGGNPNVLALPLDLLPGWLFGINADRVKPDLREKIVRYQEECFRVLWEAFKGDILPTAPPATGLTSAQQTLELVAAMYRLAEQQVALEARQATMDRRVDRLDLVATVYDERLAALEMRLDPKQVLTEEQAAELALAVKNVGQRLAAQGDRQGYAKVYSELYRRYRVSSYKNLPQAQFTAVLAWLGAWYEELGG